MSISQETKQAVANALAEAIIKHATRRWSPPDWKKTHIKVSIDEVSQDDDRICIVVDSSCISEGEGWIPLDE